MRIGNDLIEAYKGYYETELERDHRPTYNEYVKDAIEDGELAVETYESWITSYVRSRIEAHSPKERLEIYLEWNGILGYTNRIWELSQGEL